FFAFFLADFFFAAFFFAGLGAGRLDPPPPLERGGASFMPPPIPPPTAGRSSAPPTLSSSSSSSYSLSRDSLYPPGSPKSSASSSLCANHWIFSSNVMRPPDLVPDSPLRGATLYVFCDGADYSSRRFAVNLRIVNSRLMTLSLRRFFLLGWRFFCFRQAACFH